MVYFIYQIKGGYIICLEKRKKIYPQYEKTLEQQRKILDAMGDDSHEIEYNKKADLKRFQN